MNILYFIVGVIGRTITVACRIKVLGRENIPDRGPFIMASNHISGFDPPFIGSWSTRVMFYLAKRNLFKLPIVGWFLRTLHAIPLNRGAIDREAVALCVKALGDNYGLLVFPEGTRSHSGEFLEPKAGVGMLAVQAGCPIVPVYLRGTNRLFDCLLGREQLYIIFGEPLSAEWVGSFSAEKSSYVEIAAAVMERIALLRQNVLSLK